MHADGAGTKSSLAYMYYKETGDISVFKGIAQDSLVMNLDDLIAVGAVDNFLLSNTIGRNKHNISGEIIGNIIEGYEDCINMLKGFGITIKSSGGETADVGDLVRTVIVDSTIAVRMKKSAVIDNDNIEVGNVIVGLASYGKANYENEYNTGMGSNGLTSARHDVFNKSHIEKFPEAFDPNTDKSVVFCGKYGLTDDFVYDKETGSKMTTGKAVLSPTRTYAPVIKEIFEKLGRDKINGIVHNSGGGQIKCRSFGKGNIYIKDNLFPIPPLFKMIQESSGSSLAEMYQVFNMGSRMELYIKPEFADEIIDISKNLGIDARIVGRVEKNEKDDIANRVIIETENGEKFEY